LVFLGGVWASGAALALNGLDFMRLDSVARTRAVDPIINSFVAQGFRKVPDAYDLKVKCDEIIRANGWGARPLEDIALEAARQLGMNK
jgi:hypothetical protein